MATVSISSGDPGAVSSACACAIDMAGQLVIIFPGTSLLLPPRCRKALLPASLAKCGSLSAAARLDRVRSCCLECGVTPEDPTMLAATLLLAAAAGPGDVGLPAPEPWWAAVVREETARVIAADLPDEPRRFRFQCRVPTVSPKTKLRIPTACIFADAGTVATSEAMEAVALAQALQPVATAEDRLRHIAWLRVMLLHDQDEALPKPALFEVEEVISKADVPQRPLASATLPLSDFVLEAPLQVELSPRTLAADGQGVFRMICRVASQSDCRLQQPASFRMDGVGKMRFMLPSWFMALQDVHVGLRRMRVAPQTKDGRPSAGMDMTVGLNLVIHPL
jgi:hypothetical protein